jgi:hypothetical protein
MWSQDAHIGISSTQEGWEVQFQQVKENDIESEFLITPLSGMAANSVAITHDNSLTSSHHFAVLLELRSNRHISQAARTHRRPKQN